MYILYIFLEYHYSALYALFLFECKKNCTQHIEYLTLTYVIFLNINLLVLTYVNHSIYVKLPFHLLPQKTFNNIISFIIMSNF